MGGANLDLAPSHTSVANLIPIDSPSVQYEAPGPSPVHYQSVVDVWFLITRKSDFLLVCFLMVACFIPSVSVCD